MYLGTSIGIAVRDKHLEVVCLRGRWRRLVVTGFLRIEDYLARPAAEVAQQYQRFRKQNHALATSAMVALPRGAGLVRTLELPAGVAPNLAQAVAYQVDSLHPFEEGSVYFDYAVLPQLPAEDSGDGPVKNGQGGRLSVAVALVEKTALDQLYEWFCRAEIPVAGFTFSTAALYQALARFGLAGRRPFKPHGARRPLLLLDQCGETVEILGLAADGAFCSREVPATAPLEREVQLSAAELRLKPDQSPALLYTGQAGPGPLDMLDMGEPARPSRARLEEGVVAVTPEVRPAEFYLREHFVAYAAALAGLERHLPGAAPKPGLRWNLLPSDKRIYQSHWAHATASLLALCVLALALTWAAVGDVQDRLYASWLDGRIRALSPRVGYLEKLDYRQKALLEKLALLHGEQQDITRKLEAWQELTRLLPNSAWLQSLQFIDHQVIAQGVAESASALLQAVNQSPHFEQAEFTGAIARENEGREMFQMRMRLRAMVVR